MGVELPLRVVVTILECCVMFSGVKLSIRSFVLFVDLIEVVRIKIVALDAKVPFDRFSKELRFVDVGLGDFISMLQSRIIALTLWLKKVFDFMPRLIGVSL